MTRKTPRTGDMTQMVDDIDKANIRDAVDLWFDQFCEGLVRRLGLSYEEFIKDFRQ